MLITPQTTVASEQKGEEDDEEHEIGEVVADTKDGVFLMEWSDWKRYFTHLFAAVSLGPVACELSLTGILIHM